MPNIIVIGAGIGGLTTAAILARHGLSVTVLEAHVYPGGCAGTFYHQKYYFDAGATLPGGFYPDGPMDIVARAAGIDQWTYRPADPAMVVHLPNKGGTITRWGSEARWAARQAAFGPEAEAFWRWQENTADAMWQLALQFPPWPPQTKRETADLAKIGWGWIGQHLSPTLFADALRPVAAKLRGLPETLRLFVDAQLLIAAQATSRQTNALYGASALDLPRRGVVHAPGGMGAIAETLVQTVKHNGGTVHFKQEVNRIVIENGRPVAVETRRRKSFDADIVIANLPPWNIAQLLGDETPPKLRNLPSLTQSGWGAVTTYVGLDTAIVPDDFPLHHQIIVREPMSEGNTVFMSLSPDWDIQRAPAGHRTLTLSTHTHLAPWWTTFETDRPAYETRKQAYAEQMIANAEIALPGLRQAATLILPGTPVTFQRFTRRAQGWVGGFPQTNLFTAWAPCLMPNLWMVGDSIFPGQSTAAVAMGGLRVAQAVLDKVQEGQSIRLAALPINRG